jgi:hypothetical protein
LIVGSQTKRRMRGQILRLLYEGHEKQRHRMDDVTLTGVLERLHFDVWTDLVRELLQDMRERELVTFTEDRNRKTGVTAIREIQIRPRGSDVIEGSASDLAVDVE